MGEPHPDEATLVDLLFANGELHESTRRATRRHVDRCPKCRRRLAALCAAESAVQTIRDFDLDEVSARRLERSVLAAWERDRASALRPRVEASVEPSTVLEPNLDGDEPAGRRLGARRLLTAVAAAALLGSSALGLAAVTGLWGPSVAPAPDSAGAPAPSEEAEEAEEAEGPRPRPAEIPGARPRWQQASSRRSEPASSPPRRPRRSHPRRPDAPPRARPPGRSDDAPPPPRRETRHGTTSVSVLEGPSPYFEALAEAREAFYVRHDLSRALDRSRAARTLADGPAAEQVAERLECDVAIAAGLAEDAVVACARLLDDPNPERVRMTHYTLGTLYRRQLGDCTKARDHFDRAIVFGHVSLYGTDARLQRAACALEQGDLEAAREDLAILRGRTGSRELGPELDALEAELERARRKAAPRR